MSLSSFLSLFDKSDSFIRQPILYKEYKEFLWEKSNVISPVGPKHFRAYLIENGVKIIIDQSNGHKIFLKRKVI